MEAVEELIAHPDYLFLGFILMVLLEIPIVKILDSISEHSPIPPPRGIEHGRWNTLVTIPGSFGARWLGRLERTLFFLIFWMWIPELAIGWFAFKVASKWEVWNNLFKVPDSLPKADDLEYFISRTRWGSRTMQRFLVGTLLNLFAGLIGVGIFRWLMEIRPCILECLL